jgi:hypothetical protein
MKHPSRRTIAISIVVVGVVIAGIVFLLPRLSRPTLRAALSRALNVREADLVLNLPPRPDCYPGAVFPPDMSIALVTANGSQPDLRRGSAFTIDSASLGDAAAAGGVEAGWIGEALQNREGADIQIRIENGRVVEIPVPVLKKRLIESEEVRHVAERGYDPLVIIRAYEGVLRIVFTRRRGMSAAGWAAFQLRARSATQDGVTMNVKGGLSDDATLEIATSEPIVFAFETRSAKYITTHLGIEPNDVELVSSQGRSTSAPTRPLAQPAPTNEPWMLATIASGFYPRIQTLNQSWNAASADLMEEALAPYHPLRIHRLRATGEAPLTRDSLLTFARDADAAARQGGARFLLVYYIGHTYTASAGEIEILPGDASPISESNSAGVESAGKAVHDLAVFANQLHRPLSPGEISLHELYDALSVSGVPFALVIDGCVPNRQFGDFRDALGLVLGSGNVELYIGPGLPDAALAQFASRLRDYPADHPYLRSDNVVLLAAKPGTVAEARSNPRCLTGPPVGPLAFRAYALRSRSAFDPTPPSLAALLRAITDYSGTGEIALTGSVSWSDPTRLREIADRITFEVPPHASK